MTKITIELMEPSKKGETKFIFFSGKGGVGKSTMSCATAVWLAKRGNKTLLVTTDPAPNLSDIFSMKIGATITEIKGVENLSAIEIDPDKASEEYKERILSPMKTILDERSLKVTKEQLDSPCVEEVAAFDKFIEFMDDPKFDVVIFDTAPTGHTLRLLQLPEEWSQELGRGGLTCVGPSYTLQEEKAKYDKAISYLRNVLKTVFVFVMRPEESSMLETKRSVAELEKLGISTNLVIVNGVLPEEACTDNFFRNKKEQEDKIIVRINSDYSSIPRKLYFLQDKEILGVESLKKVGEVLFEGSVQEKIVEPEKALRQVQQIKKDLDEAMKRITPAKGTRYVFVTGKGGVGKSTIACTIAVRLSDKGFRILVVTTDPASHLQNIFGQEINYEPTKVNGTENLFAARIDQVRALQEYKERTIRHVIEKFSADSEIKINIEATKKKIEEELRSPCAEEMAAFEKFMSYFDLTGYDIIIIDTAPTGHTLRLLELPTSWKGFIDLGTLTTKASHDTELKYVNVIDIMKSQNKSTFISVMYPEYTPVMEAWRASKELERQVGIHTGLVAVNYIIPEQYGQNSYFNSRRREQQKYLVKIKQKFKTPMLMIPQFEHEPQGVTDLRKLGDEIFNMRFLSIF